MLSYHMTAKLCKISANKHEYIIINRLFEVKSDFK